jgi:hypothetical protein
MVRSYGRDKNGQYYKHFKKVFDKKTPPFLQGGVPTIPAFVRGGRSKSPNEYLYIYNSKTPIFIQKKTKYF